MQIRLSFPKNVDKPPKIGYNKVYVIRLPYAVNAETQHLPQTPLRLSECAAAAELFL